MHPSERKKDTSNSSSSYLACKQNLLQTKLKSESGTDDLRHCPFCHRAYNTQDCRWRLLPKMKLSRRIQKLRLKYTRNTKNISKFHKHLLDLYTNSCNRMAITCFTCKKTRKIPCQGRMQRKKQILKKKQNIQENITSSSEQKNASNTEEVLHKGKQFKKKKRSKENSSSKNSNSSADNVPQQSPYEPFRSHTVSLKSSKKQKAAHYQRLKTMLAKEREQQKQASASELSAFLSAL